MKLSNSYLELGKQFYQESQAQTFSAPSVFLWNEKLAKNFGIERSILDAQNTNQTARYFSGQELFNDRKPISLVYAGHQFGHFSPQLGDGRAHLLGELGSAANSVKYDLQLKGSGRTPFSRGGDGLCGMGPALREFIMSEAMFALGVPTARTLAVVTTGDMIQRHAYVPGAVVTRTALSHVRIGTFQYYFARGQKENLQKLANYSIKRHYPELLTSEEMGYALTQHYAPEVYLNFLGAVIEKQIKLVCEWMRVGFIHGVMNTDNTAISGETIDYGPCAMMNAYHPNTVYSSIDQHGRYAFGQQPDMSQWNLARLAESLSPLIDDDQDKAVDRLSPYITEFPERFKSAFNRMMANKLGILDYQASDAKIIHTVLNTLQKHTLDYTQSFDLLSYKLCTPNKALPSIYSQAQNLKLDELLMTELVDYKIRISDQNIHLMYQSMRKANPSLIPRNHHVETVIAKCTQSLNPSSAIDFVDALKTPYEQEAKLTQYQDAPVDGDSHYQTFCGT